MTPHTDERDLRHMEREQSLSDARAALRAEREQLAGARADAVRLLKEAQETCREAERLRDRARRLAPRFVRWVKHRHSDARGLLRDEQSHLTNERDRVVAEFERLCELRSEFHASAAATRDRLRDAWAVVETQQRRAAEDWAETERYFTEQTAQLDARAAELTRHEKAVADQRARNEAETMGLREEAAALEARVANARAALAELEAHRDRVRAELLGTEPPELVAFTVSEKGDLVEREAVLVREKTAVAALKASLESELAELADRKRVVAEQLSLLAEARARWQSAERQTVIEMEEMARDLRLRENDLDSREKRLVHADARRREDSYELWRMRLRLESWQTKLTAFELRWHTERSQLETDLEQRVTVISRRESVLEETFAKWEKARDGERERLRGELDFWTADRERLTKAVAETDLQRQMHDAELSTCAARALAAEELVASAVQDSGSDRAQRRLAVLQKRWERLFDQKVKEIDRHRAEHAAELAALTDRYRKLHATMTSVVEREAVTNNAAAAADLERVAAISASELTMRAHSETVSSAELIGLREEVERLAGLMVDMHLPEQPDEELPWGAEEEKESPASVLQFENSARAA